MLRKPKGKTPHVTEEQGPQTHPRHPHPGCHCTLLRRATNGWLGCKRRGQIAAGERTDEGHLPRLGLASTLCMASKRKVNILTWGGGELAVVNLPFQKMRCLFRRSTSCEMSKPANARRVANHFNKVEEKSSTRRKRKVPLMFASNCSWTCWVAPCRMNFFTWEGFHSRMLVAKDLSGSNWLGNVMELIDTWGPYHVSRLLPNHQFAPYISSFELPD